MNLAETFNVFGSMEAEHASRRLRFDRRGLGQIPVQAFGRIDSLHFYFRFRGDYAALRVGPFDELLENASWERREQMRMKHLAESGPDDPFGFMHDEITQREQPGNDFIPKRTTAFASIEDVTGEPYNGSLELAEFRELFARLAAELTPMPEDEQIDTSTINWLTNGGLWPLGAATTKGPAHVHT